MLNFPNPSRSYDEAGHGVRFWGYDQTFEISFLIEAGALSKIDPRTMEDEAALLDTFDGNRDRVYELAGAVYSERRKSSYIFSYILKPSDC